MKKKILVLMMVGTMALSFVACSGSDDASKDNADTSQGGNSVSSNVEEDSSEPDDIVLVESGYSVKDNGMGNVYVYYGATLNNPNKNEAASFPTITITAKGEDGSIIATQDQTLFYLAPEDTVSFGSLVDCNGKVPASVEITPSCKDFVPGDSDGVIKSSDFIISNTTEISGEYGNTSYTGEIENVGNNDADMVAVTVILKNNGQIVYGTTTFVDGVTSGMKKPFEISAYEVPEHTEYIISAQSW